MEPDDAHDRKNRHGHTSAASVHSAHGRPAYGQQRTRMAGALSGRRSAHAHTSEHCMVQNAVQGAIQRRPACQTHAERDACPVHARHAGKRRSHFPNAVLLCRIPGRPFLQDHACLLCPLELHSCGRSSRHVRQKVPPPAGTPFFSSPSARLSSCDLRPEPCVRTLRSARLFSGTSCFFL